MLKIIGVIETQFYNKKIKSLKKFKLSPILNDLYDYQNIE